MKLDIKNTPKRLKKKEAILDSALNIFAEHGYINTRLEQITDALDLTDKSIYYYFSSKGDLFIEVILLLQGKLNSLIDRIDNKDCNHHEKIKLYTSHAMSIHGNFLSLYQSFQNMMPSNLMRYRNTRFGLNGLRKVSWKAQLFKAIPLSSVTFYLDLYFICMSGIQLETANHIQKYSLL
jgi:AcrR family transcriptional regulator